MDQNEKSFLLSPEEIGSKIHFYCKCGHFKEALQLLGSLADLDRPTQEEVIHWSDTVGNTHLHVLVQALPASAKDDLDNSAWKKKRIWSRRRSVANTKEKELKEATTAKKNVCFELMRSGLRMTEENNAGLSPYNVCPDNFLDILQDVASRCSRGSSILNGLALPIERSALFEMPPNKNKSDAMKEVPEVNSVKTDDLAPPGQKKKKLGKRLWVQKTKGLALMLVHKFSFGKHKAATTPKGTPVKFDVPPA
eukprot:CAMPEP_0181298192 /NCGR_PEP_ID=MMETSP1101-20121128/5650_1 /TAXON_ID=46948 /ORGANISM="Rhodomonas abbreviata, Strain Caron Lab Isolate" /LENGTH=250 /DNA_ID=CAMNT_0023403195 /DNA_START=81 /DNA_END=833 /DNA_ORIENTATION=-